MCDINVKARKEQWARINCMWTSPPSVLTIGPDEVHVWCINLDMPPMRIQEMEAIVSGDELTKSQRFHFDKHRRHYIASHGMLRKILGSYLNLDPNHIQFKYSQLGKPTLALVENQIPLSLNLSHSNELALCAVTLNRSIGIDIEFVRPDFDLVFIAKHFFLPREYELINSFPFDQRQNAFFNLWTLKESYLKATGEGIGGLEKVEFSMFSKESIQVIINNENTRVAKYWTIQQFTPSKGYTAGLAVEGNSNYIYNYFKI